jgi:acyl-CoA reductase-like NAD-dependent aldehyde dehydrogenase
MAMKPAADGHTGQDSVFQGETAITIDDRAYEKVRRHVEDAVGRGAEVTVGGGRV